MRRYYFDLHDGLTLRDAEGELHRDDESALNAAQRSLAELVDGRAALWEEGRFAIEVSDQERRRVGRLTVVAETFA